MDFSDKIRRDQSKAAWTGYKTLTLSQQPACNFSTCCTELATTCTFNFVSYEQRNQVQTGRVNCQPCVSGQS
jgi:hypothetical protein